MIPFASFCIVHPLTTAAMSLTSLRVCSWKTFWLGVLAGFYLSFGGLLAYSIGGEVPDVRRLSRILILSRLTQWPPHNLECV